MTNTAAILALLASSESAARELDRLACLRAATWIRWYDGFGATLAATLQDRLTAGGNLAEAARQITQHFLETGLPSPPEDSQLTYLTDSETNWMTDFVAYVSRPVSW
ncbi:MAG: hypothetical protein JXQ89_23265, partial [Pelagimonas sp.]